MIRLGQNRIHTLYMAVRTELSLLHFLYMRTMNAYLCIVLYCEYVLVYSSELWIRTCV